MSVKGYHSTCISCAVFASIFKNVDSLKQFRHEKSPSTCMSVWCLHSILFFADKLVNGLKY